MRNVGGVVIGTVTDLKDPKGEGKIRVQYPWLPNSVTSAWASVSSPLAGKGRGLWFMPEMGDEVLLAFEHGDFKSPYIVGYLWNGVDNPPDTENSNRTLKTPGGHSMVFADKDGAKQIEIKSNGGHMIRLDDQNAITIQDLYGNTIVMANARITITSIATVEINAPNVIINNRVVAITDRPI